MNSARDVYVGPRPFQSADRGFFFGRQREARDLVGLVVSNRAVLLHSPPGAGKTSLLNALLLPLLKEEGFEVLPITRVGRSIGRTVDPRETKNIYIFNAVSGFGQDTQNGDRLAEVTLNQYLSTIERTSDEFGEPRPLAIIFDQLEELFSSYPERWEDRKEFFDEIGLALQRDALLRVVFSMREDYIGELEPYLFLLPEKLRNFRLEGLRKQAAIAAVEGPLRDTALSFAPGVAQRLVDNLLRIPVKTAMGISEVEGQFVEPVQLQLVCRTLWEHSRPDVGTITMEDLSAFGDVNETLSSFYEKAIQTAISATGITEGELRRWFDSALITPAGTRGIVFRSREETGGIPNAAVDELENQHIIRAELRGGQRWYELSHDRFIGPIRESNQRWYRNTASLIEQTAQWLEVRADDWELLGRDNRGLLNESELLEAQAWLSSADAAQLTYSDALLALVQASTALTRRAQFQRLIKRVTVLMIILLLVTLSLALFAFLQYRRAKKLEQLLEQHSIRVAMSDESFQEARLKFSSLQSGYPNYIE